MAPVVLLSLLLVSFVEVSEQGAPRPCFHAAGHNPCAVDFFDYHACLAHPSNWNCHENEYCAMSITAQGTTLECLHYQEPDWPDCLARQNNNDWSCDPRLSQSIGHPSHQVCEYCCRDFSCFQNIQSSTSVVNATDFPVHQPTPGGNSCYDTPCNPGDDLATCSSGRWACPAEQFCDIVIDANIHMTCRDTNAQLHTCTDKHDRNDASLCEQRLTDPSVKAHHCEFCCQDEQCVRDLIGKQTTTLSQTVTSTVTSKVTSTVPPLSARPLARHCFSSTCNQGDDLHTCTSGQWECGSNEFCKVDIIYKVNLTSMICVEANLANAQMCDDQRQHYFCPRPEDFLTKSLCHFCCPNSQCVKAISSLVPTPDTMTTAQPPTSHNLTSTHTSSSSQTPSSTPVSTSTQVPVSTSPQTLSSTTPTASLTSTISARQGCKDVYTDGWCGNFTALCSETYIRRLCPQTCNACAQYACVDSYRGDCSVDYAGQCANFVVQTMCQKTCGICDCHDLYHGDCVADYGGQCDATLIRYLCPRTCHACLEMDAQAQPNTTTGVCTDCVGLSCLAVDPSGKQCPSTKPFCFTATSNVGNATTVTRGCASKTECDAIPLMSECLGANSHLGTNTTCKFCCHEPNCNAPPDVIPRRGLMTRHDGSPNVMVG